MSTQGAGDRLELPQGTLDLLIPGTLVFGSQHGQRIARVIQETSEEELLVEQGAPQPESAVLLSDLRSPHTTHQGNYGVEAADGCHRTGSGTSEEKELRVCSDANGSRPISARKSKRTSISRRSACVNRD